MSLNDEIFWQSDNLFLYWYLKTSTPLSYIIKDLFKTYFLKNNKKA